MVRCSDDNAVDALLVEQPAEIRIDLRLGVEIVRLSQYLFVHVAQGGNDGAALCDPVHVMRPLAANADDADLQTLVRGDGFLSRHQPTAPIAAGSHGPNGSQELSASQTVRHEQLLGQSSTDGMGGAPGTDCRRLMREVNTQVRVSWLA